MRAPFRTAPERVAGGAERLASPLLPAQDEAAAGARLGERACEVLALEALPLEAGVAARRAALRGDLVEQPALALDLVRESRRDVAGVRDLEVLEDVLDVLAPTR